MKGELLGALMRRRFEERLGEFIRERIWVVTVGGGTRMVKRRAAERDAAWAEYCKYLFQLRLKGL